MPTTKWKNRLYLLALPFRAPRLERNPQIRVEGHPLSAPDSWLRLLRKNHVLGASVLLADGSRQSRITCSLTNPRREISGSSMFRVASITKMATSLAALTVLEDQGLPLHACVNDLLASWGNISPVPELEGVTVEHLLSHTSGLLDPPGLEEALLQGVPFPDLLGKCTRVKPGHAFHYSNLGFGLIGCLLEAIEREPVSIVLDRKVFSPLGMRATLDASQLDPAEIVPISRVLPYQPSKELLVTPLGRKPLSEPDPLRHYGHTAGAMYVDVFSLEKLLRCLMAEGKPLLQSGLGQELARPHAEYGKISPSLSYGLGLLIIWDPSLSAGRILGHQGFAYGCVDGAFWEEETGRIVIFLNGGASEARRGRLGISNADMLHWALKEEMPFWSGSVR